MKKSKKKLKKITTFTSLILITSLMIGNMATPANAFWLPDWEFSVSGRVRRIHGEYISGATVKLYKHLGFGDIKQLMTTTTTDSNGYYYIYYNFGIVFQGAYLILEISKSGFCKDISTYDYMPDIHTGHTYSPSLLPNSWSCSGNVLMVGGAPVTGASFTVFNERSEVVSSTSSYNDNTGDYSVSVSNPNSQPGIYLTLKMSAHRFETLSTLKFKGGDWNYGFRPKCTGQHWYGYIRDANNNPVTGALVKIRSNLIGQTLGQDSSDSNGKYDIVYRARGLLSGSARLEVSKLGYSTLVINPFHWSSGDYRYDIILANHPPNVNARPDKTVNVGEQVQFLGSIYDPGDTHTILWDFGDGSTRSGILSPTHAYDEVGIYTARLTVTDSAGGTGTDTCTITVENTEPVVEAGPNQLVNEGAIVVFSGDFTDPGTDTHIIKWDFGDGTIEFDTLTPTHIYEDEGVYLITLTVTDSYGNIGSDTLNVYVSNVAPTAVFSNDGPKDEGALVTLLFSNEFDPGILDTLTYSFDWDNDGVYEVIDQVSPSAQFTWYDNGIYTVRGMIKDNDGGYTEYTTDVVVNNVAPTATFNNDGPKDEGALVTLLFSNQLDPGSSDTFTYSFDWDDDGVYEIIDQLSPSAQYTWYDNGIYTVRGMIKDNDGGYNEYLTDVIVNNVAPTANFDNDGPQNEGAIVTLTFSAQYDPGMSDTFTYSFDWDDDGVYEIIDQLSPSAQYTWYDNGIYTVRGMIKDDDGGYTEYTTDVIVNNVAPTAFIDDVIQPHSDYILTIDEITFFGSFIDPGLDDSHIIEWDFGDGTIDFGTLEPNHTFTSPGDYLITLTVIDDDGASSSAEYSLSVKSPIEVTEFDVEIRYMNGLWSTKHLVIGSENIIANGADFTIHAYAIDWDGDPLFFTYYLDILTKPPSSLAEIPPDFHLNPPSLTDISLDLPGYYFMRFSANDGFIDSPPIYISIKVEEGDIVDYFEDDTTLLSDFDMDGQPGNDLWVTITNISFSGEITVLASTTEPAPPQGFDLAGVYYEISTTAIFNGPVTISINYDDTGLTLQEESNLRLYHYEEIPLGSGNWTWFDTSILPVDIEHNIISGTVTSLSWFAIGVQHLPPIANAGGPYEGFEGSSILFDASGSSDPDSSILYYRWDFDNDGLWETDWIDNPYMEHTWYDNHNGIVIVEVSDGELTSTATALIIVNNVAPLVTFDIVQPTFAFILPGDLITFIGDIFDPGTEDTHVIEWDFGDGTKIIGPLETTHPYNTASLYTVKFTVVDDDGGVGEAIIVITVISIQESVGVVDDYIQALPEEALLKNSEQRKNAISNKLDEIIQKINNGEYLEAISKLKHDVYPKMDGSPSPVDWITDLEAQQDLREMIDVIISYLELNAIFEIEDHNTIEAIQITKIRMIPSSISWLMFSITLLSIMFSLASIRIQVSKTFLKRQKKHFKKIENCSRVHRVPLF